MSQRVVLTLLILFAIATAEAKWKQKKFFLSFWVDPIVPPSQFPVEYDRIRNANFTALLGGFGATDIASVSAQVAACTKAGLDCVPNTCESIKGPWGSNASCVSYFDTNSTHSDDAPLGFQVIDEPRPPVFPQLAAWASSIEERMPGKLRFINLVPNYGFPAPSHAAYTAYVDEFISTVKPDILCFDHYPRFYPGSSTDQSNDDSMAGYHRNLRIIRNASLSAGIPFFNFFNTMPYQGREDVTETQLKWQTFTSLAYGSTGLLYFCYWTPAGKTFKWGQALMTPVASPLSPNNISYVPSEKFAVAARLNGQLVRFGELLLTARSTGISLLNGTTGAQLPQPVGEGIPCFSNIASAGAGRDWSVLLGGFDAAGNASAAFSSAVLIHNQDPNQPTIVTVGVPNYHSLREATVQSPELQLVNDDSPEMDGVQLYLPAGDARLFVCE